MPDLAGRLSRGLRRAALRVEHNDTWQARRVTETPARWPHGPGGALGRDATAVARNGNSLRGGSKAPCGEARRSLGWEYVRSTRVRPVRRYLRDARGACHS